MSSSQYPYWPGVYPLDAHESKYLALAEELGIESLKALITLTPERIRKALDAGDIHLNSFGLEIFDRMAGMVPKQLARRWGPDWPQSELRSTARDKSLPWHKVPTLSLAERVCVLKYVAQYYIAPGVQ